MATDKKVNYTAEMTADLIERYQAGESVEDLARAFGKPERSIRAKLVRENVYVAPEKVVGTTRDNGPTKKVILRDLTRVWPDAPVEGLQNATKEALTLLIRKLESLAPEADESDDAESQESVESLQDMDAAA